MSVTQKCSGNTSLASKRSRSWAVTAWTRPVYDQLQMSYLIFGEEICPTTQKIHFQTYVHFFNAKTLAATQKFFNGNAHIEVPLGSPGENIAYCSKDGQFEEFGERPAQGKRTDLADLAKDISNGRTVDSIALDNPMLYHQYGRTLNKLEDLALRNKFRTTMTTCTWYYGETGSGKSHNAFEGFSPSTHYVLPHDNGWWDGYTGQDCVIINDFRGHIPYDELLTLIDKWPHNVKRRQREPAPFISKKIVITSPLSPAECYPNRQGKDKIEQLLRRCNVIKLTSLIKSKQKKSKAVIIDIDFVE